MFKNFLRRMGEIWQYRDMIDGLVRRDLRGRYKGSFFGFLWNFINPLTSIIVYIVVFSNIFRSGITCYYVYLIVGIMPWNFFSDALREGSSCVFAQNNMVKKIYFPREVLPIASVTSRFINLLINYLIVLLIVFFSEIGIRFELLIYLPLLFIVEYIFALALATILSALNVYFRDVEYMTGVFLTALMWLSPIMYAIDSISEPLRTLVSILPMTTIVEGFHDVMYNQQAPDLVKLGGLAVFSIILLIVCELVFMKLERNFAEEM